MWGRKGAGSVIAQARDKGGKKSGSSSQKYINNKTDKTLRLIAHGDRGRNEEKEVVHSVS